MGANIFPAASGGSTTRFATTLISGTSYTVPAGVTKLNVTRSGGGGGGGGSAGNGGTGGATTFTGLTSTPGGVGGGQGAIGRDSDVGTSAVANSGQGGTSQCEDHHAGTNDGMRGYPGFAGTVFTNSLTVTPGDSIAYAIGAGGTAGSGTGGSAGGAGGSGYILVEYWA